MNDLEAKLILDKQNAIITAPAGHGKTEMIVDLVKVCEGKQLVLTHTNAGVDALKKRFCKKGVNYKKYSIFTIAAFCMRWCNSYPQNAGVDASIDPIADSKQYYPMIYKGMACLLNKPWIHAILSETYEGVIIDEYQDCTLDQHQIAVKLNDFLPVKVFGDPLQGIFSWAGQVVDWKRIEFEKVHIDTRPWRWMKTNPELGEFLSDVREKLKPTLDGENIPLKFSSHNAFFRHIIPDNFKPYTILKEITSYDSVLYLTQWEPQQIEFCQRELSGIFQCDEKQDCNELYKWAEQLDQSDGVMKALTALQFMSRCSTAVNTEVSSYIRHLKNGNTNFSKIKKNVDLGKILTGISEGKIWDIIEMFSWFWTRRKQPFKIFRGELLCEMQRSIKYALEHNLDIYKAAMHIRNDPGLQKRYTGFKYLASRTLLAKGLEFDCVIIDMRKDIFSARNFYVAMTRAKKMIYVISPETITLEPDKKV